MKLFWNGNFLSVEVSQKWWQRHNVFVSTFLTFHYCNNENKYQPETEHDSPPNILITPVRNISLIPNQPTNKLPENHSTPFSYWLQNN